MAVHPVALALVLRRVRPDRVRRRGRRWPRARTPCRAASPVGAQPYQIENECRVGSSLADRRAAAARARRAERSSTGSRRSSGGPPGSAAPAPRSPRRSSSARARARPLGTGTSSSGASSRSASLASSATSVVCSSSSTSPVRRRVAAITGSTARSSRRQHVVQPLEQRLEVVERGRPACRGTSASRGYVRRWKRVTTPGKPGPAPRAAQYRSAFSSASACTSSPSAVTTSTAEHVLAAPAPAAAVPALPALQQEAADADRLAVPAGEHPAVRLQERRQLHAALAPPAARWRRSPSHAISRMPPRSISSASSRTLQPAQLCPPERTETCQPRSPASRTPSTTSWSLGREQHRRRRPVDRLAAVEDAPEAGGLEARCRRARSRSLRETISRSTSSTRLPSGSARNAKRTPGSGDGRGETFSAAPASSARAYTASMSGAPTAKCP